MVWRLQVNQKTVQYNRENQVRDLIYTVYVYELLSSGNGGGDEVCICKHVSFMSLRVANYLQWTDLLGSNVVVIDRTRLLNRSFTQQVLHVLPCDDLLL